MRKPSFALAMLLLLGCNPSSSNNADGGSGSTMLSCKQVLECANACGTDADGGCTQGCVDRATPAARAQLTALTQCDQAQGCNAVDACLQSKCANEVNACLSAGSDGGVTPADGFPRKFTGKVIDSSNLGGMMLVSTGDAVFVRDDQADPRGQSGMFAFYKLETITYVATSMGSSGACTFSANETVTFNNPPAFENLVAIAKQPDGQGRYEYDITTTLSEKRPGAMTIACNPGGTTKQDFNAENNVAAGTPPPTTTDRTTLKATVMMSGRTWSWDLKGTN